MTEVDQIIPPPPDLHEVKETLEKSGFWMRPLVFLEEGLIYREEIGNTKLRTTGWSYQRDITNDFFLDILEAFKHNQIFSAAILGTPGFGKTKVMLAIAVHIQEVQKNIQQLETPPLIQTAIGKNESMKAVKKLDSNMIFVQDEDPFTSGIDSLSSEHALQNILEIVLRFHKIPYLTAAVSRKRGMVKNYFSCYLEPISRNDTKRMTICRLLSGRTLLPLGHIRIVVLPEDHPIQVSHNQKEALYKTQMLNKGGYESVSIDKHDLKIRSEALLQSILGFTDLEFTKLSEHQKCIIGKIRFERLNTAMRKLAYDFPGSSDQHKRVTDETWDKIEKIKMLINIEKDEQKKEKRKQREQEQLELKRKQKEENLRKREEIRQSQLLLIQSLVQPVIEYFDLANEPMNIRLIKHYLTKKRVIQKYLSFAIGEIEEKLFLINKGQQKIEQQKREQYKVNLESEQFIFDENAFLNILAKTPQKNRRGKPWNLIVEVYKMKQGGSTVEEVAQKFNIAGGSVSNYTNIINGKIADEMGLQYEQFRAAKLHEKLPNAEIQVAGPNSKAPDIILKFEDRIEYHSLKVRKLVKSKATETVDFLKKFSPEFKAAIATQGEMFIDFYNIANHSHSLRQVDLSRITKSSKVRLKFIGEIEILY